MHNTPDRQALALVSSNHPTSSPFPTAAAVGPFSHLKSFEAQRYNPYPSPCTSKKSGYSSPISHFKVPRIESKPERQNFIQLNTSDVVLVGRKTPSPADLKAYGCNRSFILSGKAKVSRIHAILSSSCIQVFGQNGLIVNETAVQANHTYSFPANQSVIQIDLHELIIQVSLPMIRSQTPFANHLKEAMNVTKRDTSPVYRSDSSLSDMEELQESDSEVEAEEEAQIVIQPDIDLNGLIASTLVFSPRSMMGTSEILNALLPSLPQLNMITTLKTLRTGPFGSTTTSSFKDANGKQIEQQWFYEAKSDQDIKRRESLAPFSKHVRRSQLVPKRYYYPMVKLR